MCVWVLGEVTWWIGDELPLKLLEARTLSVGLGDRFGLDGPTSAPLLPGGSEDRRLLMRVGDMGGRSRAGLGGGSAGCSDAEPCDPFTCGSTRGS